MGSVEQCIQLTDKDKEFDMRFEVACEEAEKNSASAPSMALSNRIDVQERYELHCINQATYKTPAQVDEITGLGKNDSGIKLLDCPDPTGGQVKGKLVCENKDTKYELRRIFCFEHGMHGIITLSVVQNTAGRRWDGCGHGCWRRNCKQTIRLQF